MSERQSLLCIAFAGSWKQLSLIESILWCNACKLCNCNCNFALSYCLDNIVYYIVLVRFDLVCYYLVQSNIKLLSLLLLDDLDYSELV